MNRRKKYLVFDCETCPIENIDEVRPDNMLMYDCGFCVVDRYGEVYETRSFIISQIFDGEADKMQSAYYADKIPMYLADLESGSRRKVSYYTARKVLAELLEKYNITEVYAHNMRFDFGATNRTAEWVTEGRYRRFFPYNVEICDTLKMARQLVAPMKSYRKYCADNGYLTKNNQPRLTAEILYRFISKDEEFKESHTGLEDTLIEKEILRYCLAKHKKVDRKLFKDRV